MIALYPRIAFTNILQNFHFISAFKKVLDLIYYFGQFSLYLQPRRQSTLDPVLIHEAECYCYWSETRKKVETEEIDFLIRATRVF